MIFAVSVLVLTAASANAATYTVTVQKGDCLSKIGKTYNLTWQAIAEANMDKVKNPHRIFPGQILTIPEPVKTAEGYTPIKSLGRRPFGKKRDVAKAIIMFSLPKEVKRLFIAKVEEGESGWAALKKGDKREQMVFGNYRVQNKIIMDFAEGHLEAARRYSVKWQGEIFHLEIPLKCDNPTWWSEQLPPPPPTKPEPAPLPEPEPVPPLPPVVVRPAEKPKPKPLVRMMVWDEVVETPPEIPLPLPVAIEEKWQPDFEAWAYAGSYRGVQSNNRQDWNFYKGGNISLFPYQFKFDGAVFRLGPSYQWVDWKGEVGDIIKYSGKMSLVGGEAQYITGSTKSQLKLYYGKKTDDIDGRGDLAAFSSRQWNHILAVEPSHQWWQDSGKKWFTEVEIGGRFEFDLEGNKHSSFANNKIDDPRTHQGVFMLRGKTNVYKFYNDNAALTFQLAPGYEQSPETWFMEPRAGIKFFGDIIEPAVSYKWDEGPHNDLVAGHIVLNAGELIKRVWQMFKTE